MKPIIHATKRYYILLAVILALGLFLRVYKIGSLPAGLHRDEASVGYNAYLLFHTLHDEHGRFLPLVFEAFGDWKRPINIYLSALLVPVTGMSATTIRLPVAIFGWASIYLLYMIVLKLSKNQPISLLSAFILAVSPWHIYMSRTGLGWNVVGLAIFLLACYWLLFAGYSRRHAFLSGCAFGISLFSYASNQFITPIFIIVFAVFHLIRTKKLSIHWGFIVPLIILFTIFSSVYIPVIKENSIGSTFVTDNFTYYSLSIPYSEHSDKLSARLFHNKPSGWISKYAENYLQIFSPQFLLYNTDDNPSYSLKNVGNMYLFELVFLLVGLYIFLRTKFPQYPLIVALLCIIPIPAALTVSPTSSTRTLLLVPAIALFVSIGMYYVFSFLKKRQTLYGYIFICLTVGLYSVSLLKLSDEYLVHFPMNRAEHWGNAQKQLVDYLAANEDKYDEIVISRPHETFYIYLMFHSFFDKFSPSEIAHYPKSQDGFVYAKSLGKYSFRDIQYLDDLQVPNRLLVDKALDIQELATPSSYLALEKSDRGPLYTEITVEKTIKLPDGTPVYSILSTSELKTYEELTVR